MHKLKEICFCKTKTYYIKLIYLKNNALTNDKWRQKILPGRLFGGGSEAL